MRTARGFILIVIAGVGAGFLAWQTAAQESDFHAIVERDGTVVLCLTRGQLLFADRCVGSGRLTIVQPVQEGPITWRTAFGTIAMENAVPQIPECALGRAKWDPREERATSSGKRIRKVDTASIVTVLNKQRSIEAELMDEDITAFALDLDNDGKDDIVFSASNLRRAAEHNNKTGQSYAYVVMGGIFRESELRPGSFPPTFYFEQGEYLGATDAIGHIEFKGVVPIAAETGQIALLISTSHGMSGVQDLIRFSGLVQKIETIERLCY